MWDKMFGQVDLLQKGLEASWTRNTVIRNNIANVETPGFKASDVEFESLMAQALGAQDSGFETKRTHEKHYDFRKLQRPEDVSARAIQLDDISMRMDENNVDIEAENAKLAQNSLYYNTLLTKLNSELARLRMAINEGR